MEARRHQVGIGMVSGAVALALAVFAQGPARSKAHAPQSSGQRPIPADLLDADIVFRRGADAVSRIALSYGDRPRFSHVGMVVRAGGSLRVVHAIPAALESPGGVRSDPIGTFVSADSTDVAFYRVESFSARQREQIRGFLIAAIGKPFDYQFKYSDDSALYCSELVVKAFRVAGIAMMPGLMTVQGITLSEPAIPPDEIRRSRLLRELRPNRALEPTAPN